MAKTVQQTVLTDVKVAVVTEPNEIKETMLAMHR